MRDILVDLQERANLVARKIDAERASFEEAVFQLKRERNNRLAELRTRLAAVNRLIEVAAWQQNVRAAVKLAFVTAEAVEVSAAEAARQAAQPQAEPSACAPAIRSQAALTA